MTGLEKWKEERIDRIGKFNVEDAIVDVLTDFDGCKYCEYSKEKSKCEKRPAVCSEGIKAYLESEAE